MLSASIEGDAGVLHLLMDERYQHAMGRTLECCPSKGISNTSALGADVDTGGMGETAATEISGRYGEIESGKE